MQEYQREHMLSGSEEVVDEELRIYDWVVYPKYEIGGVEGQKFLYAPLGQGKQIEEFIAAERENRKLDRTLLDALREQDKEQLKEQLEKRRRYEPLARYSADLFLHFARWPEEYDMDKEPPESTTNMKAALEWAETFGVLGLNPTDSPIPGLSPSAIEYFLGRPGPDGHIARGRRNKARGGYPNETVQRFVDEAWEAHMTLKLYEAVTAEGGPDAETIVGLMSDEQPKYLVGTRDYPSTRDQWGQDPDTARLWALGVVEERVQRKIEKHCWPILIGEPGNYKQGWAFDSLLGAMWLQMLWLMLSGSRRCWWCNKVIDLDESNASEHPYHAANRRRKTRSDQRFCNNGGRCRARWNYHHGTGKSSKQARKQKRDRQRGKT